MLILVTILSLLSAVSEAIPSVISLPENRSLKFMIPSQSKFQLTIRPSQFSHLLVQLDSCRLGFIKVINASTSLPVPPASLYQFSYVYNITQHLLNLTVDFTTTNLSSYLTVYGFSDFSKLPGNIRTVSAIWTDQKLTISFDPVSIYLTVIECNYTIQFYPSPTDYNCKFNDTEHVAGQITIPSQISNNITFINIQIPLNNQYMTVNQTAYSFNRLSQIQQLLNSGSPFQIQIYAQITKPVVYDVHYIKTKIEPQATLETLANGFIIIIVGVLVYALISCIYLFCKRKYKNPNYFHEETEPQQDFHQNNEMNQIPHTPVTATDDQLNHN